MAFRLVLLVGTVLAVELICRAGLWAISGGAPRAELETRRLVLLEEHAQPRTESGDLQGWSFEGSILHPYLGFAREPQPEDLASYGFRSVESGPAPSPSAAAPEVFRVAVTGGSVAESFFRYMTTNPDWIRGLREIPELRNRRIVHTLLGLRGYKQPQQLLATAYLLSLGGDLDLLINLDGYNEIGLAGALYRSGVFPAYPFHWPALTAGAPTPRQLRALAGLEAAQEGRRRLAAFGQQMTWTATGDLLWLLLDRHSAGKVADAQASVDAAYRPGGAPAAFFRTGPLAAVEGRDVYAWSAEVWARSSIQLERLSRTNGFIYLHFLQPNQYVEGSKPLSELELARAFDPSSSHAQHVRQGYPHLIAAGRRLAEQGSWFNDLTRIFEDTPETVYLDSCCHLDPTGNRILSLAILGRVRESLAAGKVR